MSKYSEVRNDYTDENGVTHIDAWDTENDNENGRTIALVIKATVYYKDYDAITDSLAQEFIQETIKEQKAINNEIVVNFTENDTEELVEKARNGETDFAVWSFDLNGEQVDIKITIGDDE